MSNNMVLKRWISPNPELLPDFIIGGAMKAGTTTLHEILNKHPDVFIPAGELHFFDSDDLIEHPDFSYYDSYREKWIYQSMEQFPEKMWTWYSDKFKGAEKSLKGEDSTIYLPSYKAAERIAIQEKQIKLIFLLRHPTKRAYSNYYHLLRTGRALHDFEDTIRLNPYSILNKSLYKKQLENYLRFIPKDRIKIVLFEELVQNPKIVVQEICDYLNIEYDRMPEGAFQTHANKGNYPQNFKLQTIRNQFIRNYGKKPISKRRPINTEVVYERNNFAVRVLDRFHSKINPTVDEKNVIINTKTSNYLDEYFFRELEGIDELVEKNILSTWF